MIKACPGSESVINLLQNEARRDAINNCEVVECLERFAKGCLLFRVIKAANGIPIKTEHRSEHTYEDRKVITIQAARRLEGVQKQLLFFTALFVTRISEDIALLR